MRAGVALLWFCAVMMPATASAAEKSPRELYDALNALRIDPAATYTIDGAHRIELRRADVQLSLEGGQLGFFTALDGRTTGAVFAGRGHALGVPRGAVEKQQMARFLGAPLLDQEFTYAYLRFTDDTMDDLLLQLHAAKIEPQQDSAFASRWDALLATVNPAQSLRIMSDSLSQNPRPYFYA